MSEERIGFLASIWRFFTFYKWRKSLAIARAADQQFTGSVAGISDAVDLTREQWLAEFNGLKSAVAQVENVLEDKKTELQNANEEEKKLLQMREGALHTAEGAKDKDPDTYTKAKAAFERYQEKIVATEERQKTLEQQITDTEQSVKKHMLRLTEFQAKIQALPEEKARLVSDFVSNKALIDLNNRLTGMQSSLESGPLDAVRKANRQLSAEARISDKLAGTDSRLQDDDFARAGREATSENAFDAMLSARKAEREQKTGGGVAVAEKVDDRPKI